MEEWVVMAPEGILRCRHGPHPVLVLREIEGSRSIALRLDPAAVAFLSAEFAGKRSRLSRTYETLEDLVTALGGEVRAMTLRLAGDRKRLAGTIEVARDARQLSVRAHPGDVAALAWRYGLPVLVPRRAVSQRVAVSVEREACRPPEGTSEATVQDLKAFRRFLQTVNPEDFGREPSDP